MPTPIDGRTSPISQFMMDEGIPQQFNPSIRAFINHQMSTQKSEIHSWRGIAENAEKEIEELDGQIQAANQTILSLQKALGDAKKSSAFLEEEKAQLSNQIDDLSHSSKTDTRAISELNEAKSALKTLEKDLASSGNEIISLKTALTQTTKNLEELQKKYDQVSCLSSTVQDLTDEITRLRREANTSSRTIENLEQQVRDLQDEKRVSQEDSGTAAGKTLSEEFSQITSQEEEMKSLKAANNALRNEKADLTNQLNEAKKSAGNMTKVAVACAVTIASMAISFFR